MVFGGHGHFRGWQSPLRAGAFLPSHEKPGGTRRAGRGGLGGRLSWLRRHEDSPNGLGDCRHDKFVSGSITDAPSFIQRRPGSRGCDGSLAGGCSRSLFVVSDQAQDASFVPKKRRKHDKIDKGDTDDSRSQSGHGLQAGISVVCLGLCHREGHSNRAGARGRTPGGSELLAGLCIAAGRGGSCLAGPADQGIWPRQRRQKQQHCCCPRKARIARKIHAQGLCRSGIGRHRRIFVNDSVSPGMVRPRRCHCERPFATALAPCRRAAAIGEPHAGFGIPGGWRQRVSDACRGDGVQLHILHHANPIFHHGRRCLVTGNRGTFCGPAHHRDLWDLQGTPKEPTTTRRTTTTRGACCEF
mmetsp:Transcript_18719/g.46500  ORF Transcript_18719/g.46500 Transcript_18719/m.46500 type:complete len:356 (+) Transcript_18719:295-1362(+)